MTAIKEVVSSAEVESKRLDKVFAGLGAGGNLSKEFELLGRRGQEAFGEMSSRAQQLAKDIQEDTISLSNLEKMQKSLNYQYESGKITLDDYISAQARLSILHDNVSEAIRTNEQALRSETATMDMAEDSMVSMQRQVTLLTTSYMKLSQGQRESAEGQQILKNLSEVQTRLQNATAAMTQYGSAAGRQFNGLNFSIQQIARELPSLAMGPQMFFMAISNNLPMFTDELARARKEYAQFKAEGKSATPVWKQMVSSIFSWQTALVAGITLLTMYGDEIVSWVSSLLKGREAVMSTTKALKEMQKAADFDSAGQQISSFERLRNLYVAIGDSADEKRKFIEQYKSEIEKTGVSISNINEADNLFVTNADAFVESIRQRAMAMAGMELASEQFSKALKQQVKDEKDLAEAEAELERLRALPEDYTVSVGSIGSASAGGQGTVITQSRDELIAAEEKLIKSIKDRSQTYLDAGLSYIVMSNDMTKAADEALDRAGIDAIDKAEMAKNAAERVAAINAQQAQITALMGRDARERIRREVELENQVEQARIDAMSDGFDKEMAQRSLDGRMSLQALERQKQEYIDSVVDGEKALFDAREELLAQQDENYVKKIFDASSVKVDTSMFDSLYEKMKDSQSRYYADAAQLQADAEAEQIASEEAAMNEYLSKYGSYQEKKLAISEQYINRIINAENQWERKALEREMQQNLNQLKRAYEQSYRLIFRDPSTMSRAAIGNALQLAYDELEELGRRGEDGELLDPESYKAISDAIERLKNAAESLDLEGWNDGMKGILQKVMQIARYEDEIAAARKSGNREAEENAVLSLEAAKEQLRNNLAGTGVDLFTSSLQSAAEAMKEIAEISGDTRLAGMADQMGAFAQNLGAAAQGASQGGWIGAIVGGVTDMVSQTKSAITSAKVAQAQLVADRKAFVDEMNLLALQVDEDSYDTIFGTKSISMASDAYKKAQEALTQYNEKVKKQMELPEESTEFNSLGAAIFAPFLGAAGFGKQQTNEFKTQLDAYKRGLTELQGMAINVTNYSGWAKFWGKKDRYQSLADLAPELFNEDDSLNIDAAKAFLETNRQITDEQRSQIQNAIDLQQAYEDAIAVVDEQISSVFGGIASQLTDIISDSVLNGSDAWTEFGKVGAETISDLGKQMLQELMIGEYFEQYRDRMREAYSQENPEDVQKELAAITAEMFNGMKDNIPMWQEMMEKWYAMMEEYGFDTDDLKDMQAEAERTSTSKGIAQASQDSVDELNGRATVIQGHTSSIAGDMKTLVSTSAMMLDRLTAIEANTARLEAIETGIIRMRTDISDIKLKGLIMKRA